MRPVRTVVLAAGLLALSALSLQAQATLRPGSTARGELKAGDLKLDDDTWADLWRFTGERGQTARVTLRSGDFDAYLVVGYYDENGEFVDLDSDDDGAGGTDSQVEVTLPRDGEYVARANTLSEGETGDYTLDLEFTTGRSDRADRGDRPSGPRPEIKAGEKVRGTLTRGDEKIDDGSYADAYRFTARRGQKVLITLDSKDFDAFLHLGRENNGRWEELDTDDDGGGETDSRIEFSLPADGEYVIRANTLQEGETGDYTLRLEFTGTAGDDRADRNRDDNRRRDVRVRRDKIEPNQTIRGELNDRDELNFDTTYVDTYVYEGKRGDELTVFMMSPDFGSYVLVGKAVRNPEEFSSIETKGATRGSEAELHVTLPEDGRYWIRANSFEHTTGSYTLTLKRRRR